MLTDTKDSPTTWAIWNGQLHKLSDLKISVEDRAFFFGDGIYEVIRVYGGKPFLLKEHLQRLEDGIRKMAMTYVPDNLAQQILANIAHNQIEFGFVYLQLTRGTAPREHAFPKHTPCNLLLYTKPSAEDPYAHLRESGAKAITVDDLRWLRRDIKTVNLLANCMAKQAAVDAGCYEAIQIEADGYVTEGSSSNIFIVRENILITHPKDHHILPGITRDFVITLAAELNIAIVERLFTKAELLAASEVFVTSTSAEILSLTQIDGIDFSQKRRLITNKLQSRFQEAKRAFIKAAH
jgi:D-alanine transaminase